MVSAALMVMVSAAPSSVMVSVAPARVMVSGVVTVLLAASDIVTTLSVERAVVLTTVAPVAMPVPEMTWPTNTALTLGTPVM